MMFLVYCHVIVITFFSVVILLFCSQESHIPEDALLGENLERSLKFGFERFGETLIFFCSQGLCAAVGGERKLEIIIIIIINWFEGKRLLLLLFKNSTRRQ